MACEPIATNLTDEQKSRIYGVIAMGCDWQTAANLVGCSLSDIRGEMQRDTEFALQVRRSEASAELSHMRTIQKAIEDPKNWRTSVWWLERHAPERFARHAGAITTRQLKLFIAVLADVFIGDGRGSVTCEEIASRLNTLADSLDQALCDEPTSDASGLPLMTSHWSSSVAGDAEQQEGGGDQARPQ